jgi:N-acetylglucosamine kinase-like BadF-type ATPase
MMQAKPVPHIILTIDAGGTTVRFRLERDGSLLHDDWSIPASPDGHPPAFLSGLPQPDIVVAGITKVSRPGVVDAWKRAFDFHFPVAQHVIVPDFELAAAASIDRSGAVMLLAGTGSLACVFDGNTLLRVGGRGWEYGDEGSGAFITTEAVRRCVRSLDGMLPTTPLLNRITDVAETTDAGAFATWARSQADLDGRGFLLPLIAEAAAEEDRDAINLLQGAGGWLARLARTTHQKVASNTDIIHVRAVGGLWETGPFIGDATVAALQKWYATVDFQRFAGSHLSGGRRLAAKCGPSAAVVEQL